MPQVTLLLLVLLLPDGMKPGTKPYAYIWGTFSFCFGATFWIQTIAEEIKREMTQVRKKTLKTKF
jgi:hypothetical protein